MSVEEVVRVVVGQDAATRLDERRGLVMERALPDECGLQRGVLLNTTAMGFGIGRFVCVDRHANGVDVRCAPV